MVPNSNTQINYSEIQGTTKRFVIAYVTSNAVSPSLPVVTDPDQYTSEQIALAYQQAGASYISVSCTQIQNPATTNQITLTSAATYSTMDASHQL